jgi:hypothetical protein
VTNRTYRRRPSVQQRVVLVLHLVLVVVVQHDLATIIVVQHDAVIIVVPRSIRRIMVGVDLPTKVAVERRVDVRWDLLAAQSLPARNDARGGTGVLPFVDGGSVRQRSRRW